MPRAEEANSQTSTTASSPTERSPSSQSPQPCERSSQSSTQGSRQSNTNRVDDGGGEGHARHRPDTVVANICNETPSDSQSERCFRYFWNNVSYYVEFSAIGLLWLIEYN